MATDYTTNYNLDKYTANDKPNLRDQYNAAMDKIDLALLSANTNATEAKAATQSFAGDIAAKADQTDLDALGALLPAAQFSSQNTIKAALDAKASQSALNQTNTNLSSLNTLTSELSKSAKKSIILIGDSYANNSIANRTPTWQQIVTTALSNKGWNVRSGFTSGASFNNGGFLSTLTSVVSQMTNTQKDECKMVIVGGGHNDGSAISSQSVLNSSIENFKQYVTNNLPNAIILLSHFGSVINGSPDSTHANDTEANMLTSYNQWLTASRAYSILFDFGAWSTLNSFADFDTDRVHPTSAGSAKLGNRILNLLFGIDNHINWSGIKLTNWLTPEQGVNITGDFDLRYISDKNGYPHGACVGTPITDITIDFSPYKQVGTAGKYQVKLGTYQQPIINAFHIGIPCACIALLRASSSSFRYVNVPGVIYLTQGNAYLRFNSLDSAHTSWATEDLEKVRIGFSQQMIWG